MSEDNIKDELLENAINSLGEHFTSVLILATAPDEDDEQNGVFYYRRQGEPMASFGLATAYLHRQQASYNKFLMNTDMEE